jgi:hypothetical protein
MSRDLAADVPERQLPKDTRISGYAAELSEVARSGARRTATTRARPSPPPRAGITGSALTRSAHCNIPTLHVDAESPTGALSLYERVGFTRQSTSATVIKELTDQ